MDFGCRKAHPRRYPIFPRMAEPSSSPLAPIVFRPLRADEADEACKLARDVFDRFIAPTQEEKCRQLFHRYAQPEQLIHRHTTRYTSWVAATGSQLIGLLHIHACNHIAMLFVIPELQNHHCGTELIQTAMKAGALRPPLTVNSSPNADRFYAKLGFLADGLPQTVKGVRFHPMRLAQ